MTKESDEALMIMMTAAVRRRKFEMRDLAVGDKLRRMRFLSRGAIVHYLLASSFCVSTMGFPSGQIAIDP